MSNRPAILFMEARENLFGHRRQNEAIIKALSKFADVTIAFPDNWFSDLPQNIVYYKYTPVSRCKKISIDQIVKSCKCLGYANRLDRRHHYDYVFFSSYIIYALAGIPLLIKNSRQRVFVLHHNIVDQISESRIKGILFRLCRKRIRHVLIEDFVKKNFIEETGVPAGYVSAIPHQLNEWKRDEPIEFDFVGISNSNDEIWVKKIVDAEQKTGCFMKKNIRIVLRSQNLKFDDGFLTVIKGRLSDTDYYNYIQRSRVVLVPFPASFRYRVSGTVVDALSNQKKVMGSNIPVVAYYADRYPNICMTGVDLSDLLVKKESMELKKKEMEQFADFVDLHSDLKLEEALRKIFLTYPS